jgi:hypothetical protein
VKNALSEPAEFEVNCPKNRAVGKHGHENLETGGGVRRFGRSYGL